MWVRIIRIVLLPTFILITSCEDKGANFEKYQSLSKKSDSEISTALCKMTPSERVSIYLYASEKRRPSNFGMISKKCMDVATTRIAINLLRNSDDEKRTFALVAFLHEVPIDILNSSNYVLDASAECSKFFKKDSACHSLASDIKKMKSP